MDKNTMMTRYYVLDGRKPILTDSVQEWVERFDMHHRHVASDMIGDVRISTVFLGLDHNWGLDPPLLFETMIFGGEHDQYQTRCSTWEQAEEMHQKALTLVRGTHIPK